jgi:hypothetical protein
MIMTKQELRGFQSNFRAADKKKLPKMEELFERMWKNYDQYIKLANDLPFWSTEWNLVGHLAVAASKFGPVALEYSEKKPRGRKTRRPDAWFRMSDKPRESGQEMIIEAKRDMLSLTTNADNIADYVTHYFKQCGRYLANFCSKNEASWVAPIFFLQLYSPDSRWDMNYSGDVKKLKNKCACAYGKIRKETKCENPFYAYYVLTEDLARNIKDQEDDYHYPGIVIFGDLREVKT